MSYCGFNGNVAFLSNLNLNNLKKRVSNNPCDKITKESLKPLVTNKLRKFRIIFTRKSYLAKSPYICFTFNL